MSDCRHIETLLVDHALSELDQLKTAYVMAHLSRCQRCAQAADRLGIALVNARNFEVELDEDDLDRLSANLGPYLVPQRASWAVPSALAAAALVGGLWALWPTPVAPPITAPIAIVAPSVPMPAAAEAQCPPLLARAPAELSVDWSPTRTWVLRAPEVAVDVADTRYSGEARRGSPAKLEMIARQITVPDAPAQTPPPTILEELLEAEALAREGDHRGALELYERMLAKHPNERQRAMARFERARLWIKLGRTTDARSELDQLQHGPGEIGRQAAVLICELAEGCDARDCLDGLGDRVSADELARLRASTRCDR